MFRTLCRHFLPNRLDSICKRAARRGEKNILLCWNRGLGDIPLGLYAIVHRIRHWIPDAAVTFLIRENLQEGFSLLQGVQTIAAPDWKRGEPYDVEKTLSAIGRSPSEFDIVIPWPTPTDWVRWQRGTLVPRLTWDESHDGLCKRFDLPHGFTYIGIQLSCETDYGLWRNWPVQRWREFFDELKKFPLLRPILFGIKREETFESGQVIDLRGQTSLLEALSIIKNRCRYLIALDSGLLSMSYYLDALFPLQIISLWADPDHGILKQNVPSPNPLLIHRPLIGQRRDLSSISAQEVLQSIIGAHESN